MASLRNIRACSYRAKLSIPSSFSIFSCVGIKLLIAIGMLLEYQCRLSCVSALDSFATDLQLSPDGANLLSLSNVSVVETCHSELAKQKTNLTDPLPRMEISEKR